MNLTAHLFETIDLRSFTNLWYWILLAGIWTVVSQRVLGVPFDLIQRARRQGGAAAADLRDLLRINAARLAGLADRTGPLLPALVCFVLTVLALLGFVYDVEFAQALVLILAPLTLVMALSLRLARRLAPLPATEEDLHRLLALHRIACQMIGMVSIFLTVFWGMWQNLNLGALAR